MISENNKLEPNVQASRVNENVEKLNRALPPLEEPESRNLMAGESAKTYYARMEPFRRVCEARSVLRWIAGGEFNLTAYFTKVSIKRGRDSALILKNDVTKLFSTVLEIDPALNSLLYPQLKQLSDKYKQALSDLVK